ncbi:hypothetical protein FGO68_gene11993 [Halteria grandinella]|uniref:EF-hand domain-containing protein n=1 Tax=Halteria grandinella TaxID=5974 RepID=A0A8J8NS70_HALGN|nr:hypothetical protein FGO68_gene11993 [Halteria grandinella]
MQQHIQGKQILLKKPHNQKLRTQFKQQGNSQRQQEINQNEKKIGGININDCTTYKHDLIEVMSKARSDHSSSRSTKLSRPHLKSTSKQLTKVIYKSKCKRNKRIRKSYDSTREFMRVRELLSQNGNGFLSRQDFTEIAHHFGITSNQAYKWNWDITKREHESQKGLSQKTVIESQFDLSIQKLAEEFKLTGQIESQAQQIIRSDSPKRTRIVTKMPQVNFEKDQKASEQQQPQSKFDVPIQEIDNYSQTPSYQTSNLQKKRYNYCDIQEISEVRQYDNASLLHSWNEDPYAIQNPGEIIAPLIDQFFNQPPQSNESQFNAPESNNIISSEQSIILAEKHDIAYQYQKSAQNWITSEFLKLRPRSYMPLTFNQAEDDQISSLNSSPSTAQYSSPQILNETMCGQTDIKNVSIGGSLKIRVEIQIEGQPSIWIEKDVEITQDDVQSAVQRQMRSQINANDNQIRFCSIMPMDSSHS